MRQNSSIQYFYWLGNAFDRLEPDKRQTNGEVVGGGGDDGPVGSPPRFGDRNV